MTLADIIAIVIGIVESTFAILLAFIVLAVLIGGALLIWGAGDTQRSATGKRMLFWGLVALVGVVALWSIVQIIQITFGLDNFGA
ncbi:hypothetical protein GVX82_03925 [Patescibacteria group bacterium]|jgi:hypothetical protein|nr:hypothetical protein [Patescibacteria group bacterium]